MGSCQSKENDFAPAAATSTSQTEVNPTQDAVDMVTGNKQNIIKIELSLECEGLKNKDILSKSDPFCVVYLYNESIKIYEEIGRTEIIANSNQPKWVKKFVLPYHFEMVQKLKFEVYDCDDEINEYINVDKLILKNQDFLGGMETVLGRICGDKDLCCTESLLINDKEVGKIIFKAEELATCLDEHNLILSVSSTNISTYEGIFLRLSKCREDGSYVGVYKTEVNQKTISPEFRISGKTVDLCNGDLLRPLKIEILSWKSNGKHAVLGEVKSNLQSLSSTASGNKSIKATGDATGLLLLIVKECVIKKHRSFLDYILGDTELRFTVALDFTFSNGIPSSPRSLHYIDPTTKKMNAYAKALCAIGDVIQFYSRDRRFAVYGFGGSFGDDEVNHCFSLTGNENDPYVDGIHGILTSYYEMLSKVTLSGPTHFAPLINRVAYSASKLPQNETYQGYEILLILTDGIVDDMDKTTEAIVEASNQPLSILIIGIGNDDFERMEVLDSDNNLLTTKDGKRSKRDIVQFTKLSDFRRLEGIAFQQALAKSMLEEIPRQVVEFYESKHIDPSVKRTSITSLPASTLMKTTSLNVSNSNAPPPLPPPYFRFESQDTIPVSSLNKAISSMN